MASARATLVWSGTTTTGTSTAQFEGGVGHTRVAAYVSNDSTKDFIFTVDGTVGGSTSSVNLIAAPATDASTGADVVTVSTGTFVFDKAGITVTTNNTTNGLVKIWLAGV